MKTRRIIFSIYIKISQSNWDVLSDKYNCDDVFSKSEKTYNAFEVYYNRLIECKKAYADICDVDYILFEDDNDYQQFKIKIKQSLPDITEYNIINFYKFDRLEYLAEYYDEVLFLDFDVVPFTTDSFFNVWNCKDSFISASSNTRFKVLQDFNTLYYSLNFRSPEAKMLNSMLLCQEYDMYVFDLKPYNTGIMGASKELIHKLNYFEDFEILLEHMTEITKDKTLPEEWRVGMGWDNETVFGFRVFQRTIPVKDKLKKWHSIIEEHLPSGIKLGHFIHKNFELFPEWNK
jgi:hypothetical protein